MVDLITLEEYKIAKNISKTDQDAVLTPLISTASQLITDYLGKKFVNDGTPITEVFDLDYDATTLYLEHYPVTELVAITELDPYAYDSTVHFPTAAASYILDSRDGKLIRTGGKYWPQGYGAISVTYHVGADDVADIPQPLKQATIDLVTYYAKEEYIESKSMRGATLSSGSTNSAPSTDFPPHIQRVLDIYK